MKQDSKQTLLYCLTYSQIWLIPHVDDCQSTYLTKLKKKKKIPGWNLLQKSDKVHPHDLCNNFWNCFL
jgi:hypothetical protein